MVLHRRSSHCPHPMAASGVWTCSSSSRTSSCCPRTCRKHDREEHRVASHFPSCHAPVVLPMQRLSRGFVVEFCLSETQVRKAARDPLSKEELRAALAQGPATETMTSHFTLTLQADFRHLLSGSSHETKIPFNTRAPFPPPASPLFSHLKGFFWAQIHQKKKKKDLKQLPARAHEA